VVTIVVLAASSASHARPARSACHTIRNVSPPSLWERIEETASDIRSRCASLPETAIVLGSDSVIFPTRYGCTCDACASLPHWPASKVVGQPAARHRHGGGPADRRASGRVHFYEGYDLATVAFATRVMGRLGVKRFILTNAAGGINTAFAQGALMIIDDHINLMGSNPLIGPNDDRFGRVSRT
jgi:purine-nucleoside phosphorylase